MNKSQFNKILQEHNLKLEKILIQTAEQYGATIEEVNRNIELAYQSGVFNSDPQVKANCKIIGKNPSAVEILAYTTGLFASREIVVWEL